MFLRVLEMVLPVLILLLLGCWCRFRQIFDHGGLMGLKSVISNIALPVVLFNAFFTAKYSLTVAMLFVAVYIGFCLTMAAGFGLRRLAAPYGKFMPFLLSGAEGGMLGYALYGLLTGEQSGFAAVDLGQTVFAYTAFLAVLKSTDGQTLSARMMLRNMVTNRCFGNAAGYHPWGGRFGNLCRWQSGQRYCLWKYQCNHCAYQRVGAPCGGI